MGYGLRLRLVRLLLFRQFPTYTCGLPLGRADTTAYDAIVGRLSAPLLETVYTPLDHIAPTTGPLGRSRSAIDHTPPGARTRVIRPSPFRECRSPLNATVAPWTSALCPYSGKSGSISCQARSANLSSSDPGVLPAVVTFRPGNNTDTVPRQGRPSA